MLNCLVVDDEPIARNLLEKYIKRAPGLQLIGAIDNGLEVIPFLAKENVDLMFLDINMPQFSGIELLKVLRNPLASLLQQPTQNMELKATIMRLSTIC